MAIGKSVIFNLAHIGLLLVLLGAAAGIPFHKSSTITISSDSWSRSGLTQNGDPAPLPFEIRLADFKTDFHKDGSSPKQFTSTILVRNSEGLPQKELTTSVNHPCWHKGYLIYQTGYGPQYSTLTAVKDPLMPLIIAGMILLLAAAVKQLSRTWKSKSALPAILALAVIFAGISLARINFGTLPPALRSLWFFPHVLIYMLAYAVMAMAFITSILEHATKRIPAGLPFRLLSTASSLMLIGMLLGASWAKLAWGDFWTWDPKENWAAITWGLTLLGTHLPHGRKNIRLTVIILAAFLSMQMTWYGINYLPSSRTSLHTYNQSKPAGQPERTIYQPE